MGQVLVKQGRLLKVLVKVFSETKEWIQRLVACFVIMVYIHLFRYLRFNLTF